MQNNKITVELKNLSIGYGDIVVADNINITAEKGEMICLLGPNGAGKTTLLRTLTGHLAPISGDIIINGKSIVSIPKNKLAKELAVVLTEKIDPGLFTSF